MAGSPDLVELTGEIVSAYVSHNPISQGQLPALIAEVYAALVQAAVPAPPPEEALPLRPMISIRKSITPDYLISLETGQQFKSLKRHLSARGMTPEDYRRKWGLPIDYPMVAPSYAAVRADLAREHRFGRGRPNRRGSTKRALAR